MKKIAAVLMLFLLSLTLVACGGNDEKTDGNTEKGKTYKIGICNYVDDASLNQIVENLQAALKEEGEKEGVTFDISYDNCHGDPNVMNQIISNFMTDDVDLMVGVATPVAMAMQTATEDSNLPVVFASVSDPEGTGLVESLKEPGANVTGTSDALATDTLMDILFAVKPDAQKIGLLYDVSQDSGAKSVKEAKTYLKKKGVEVVEHTGTTVAEVQLAASAMVQDKVDAVFTPTDNTVMTAELSIYEELMRANIPHITGADSFALNGAFLGYGVDYKEVGRETGRMIADILLNDKNPGEVPVKTFDNGTATINTDVIAALGLDFDNISKVIGPFCTNVQGIRTAEDFED